jgi:hypothetical protein
VANTTTAYAQTASGLHQLPRELHQLPRERNVAMADTQFKLFEDVDESIRVIKIMLKAVDDNFRRRALRENAVHDD